MTSEPNHVHLPSTGDDALDMKLTRYQALAGMVIYASHWEAIQRDLLMAAVSADEFRGYSVVAGQNYSWVKQQLVHFAQQYIQDEDLKSEVVRLLNTGEEMWKRRNEAVHGMLDDVDGVVTVDRPKKGQFQIASGKFHTGEMHELTLAFQTLARHFSSIRHELHAAGMLCYVPVPE